MKQKYDFMSLMSTHVMDHGVWHAEIWPALSGCRRVKDFEETEPRSNWAYLQNGAQIFAFF